VDCLSPSSGCAVNFLNVKQPKITFLFTAPACISFIRIPSPSNVQQFSYSMYDENGSPIQLPEANDQQGKMLSSFGDNPLVELKQYTCGYSIIIQLLATNDNKSPVRVNVDIGSCFQRISDGTGDVYLILLMLKVY